MFFSFLRFDLDLAFSQVAGARSEFVSFISKSQVDNVKMKTKLFYLQWQNVKLVE